MEIFLGCIAWGLFCAYDTTYNLGLISTLPTKYQWEHVGKLIINNLVDFTFYRWHLYSGTIKQKCTS